ncbi:MAG: 50S ribosomal protein L25, partial [Candidatus Methylomirabilis sp.]|nr:50S ribosomal protein L25 [Deltaproteobacteria bacterium]
MRGQGRIPGVVYGSGKAATELSLDLHELTKILARPDAARSLFDLHVEGQAPRLVLLKEIQRHMIKGTPRHADFLEVDETKPIVVNV